MLLPTFPGLPPLVAVLLMGLTDSPPFFCVFTETICGLTNQELHKNLQYPPHKLEDITGKIDFADCQNTAPSKMVSNLAPSVTKEGFKP
jgi:hypothetical protein